MILINDKTFSIASIIVTYICKILYVIDSRLGLSWRYICATDKELARIIKKNSP